MKAKERLTYKAAGVDTAKADEFVNKAIKMMKRTHDPRVLDNPWGFAGLFALNYPGQLFTKHYRRPVLVGCTDGVGTKLKIAFMMDKHDTVGIDLVAMSINDLIVQGAEPLFFLDYIATGKVDKETLLALLKGIVKGCREADCALLGGETAEMPGFYKRGEYEMAGFALGITDQDKIITGRNIKPGDLVVGLASNGLHSNGYSLVRKVFLEKARIKVTQYIKKLGSTLGEELLKPTRIYARPIKEILRRYRVKKAIKGIAHITGGGMPGNIPRILPPRTAVEIETKTWKIPPVFKMLQKQGNITTSEMYRVFNMGIGMIIIVDSYFVNAIIKQLRNIGERPYVIGKVTRGNREVKII